MEISPLPIDGAFVVRPVVHGDSRGSFAEWFRADRFAETTGHRFDLRQANCSVSAAGTLRGVHFADVPPGQAKYVACLSGTVLDVVVDIRVGSPTYGAWEAVRLDSAERTAVYLGEGLGHAFMALSDAAVVAYLCSEQYRPGHEHGISPLDPALAIAWPTDGVDGRPLVPILSDKDAAAPSLAEAEQRGLLPTWEACRDYVRSLPGG